MADETSGGGKSGDKPSAEDVAKSRDVPQPEEDATSYTVGRLRAEASQFGLNSADLAGAFVGVADSKEITLKDAKERVRKFLAAPESKDTRE